MWVYADEKLFIYFYIEREYHIMQEAKKSCETQ